MKLTDELAIDAPLQDTWPMLLDVPTVARALPGASIEPEPVQGEYRGQMKVKLGPVSAEYGGVARLLDVDDDAHHASFRVIGREARGQGTAEATITITGREVAGVTRVRVDTELGITGRQAQLGRGIMEQVAAGLLREFASRLELTITARTDGSESAMGARGKEVFDAGAVVYRPLLERAAILATGVLIGLGLGHLSRRR